MPTWSGLTVAKSATWRVSVLNSRTLPALVVTAPHDTRPACRRPPEHAGRACKTHGGEAGTHRAPGPLRRSCDTCRTRAAAGILYRGLAVTSPPAVVAFADFADPRKNAPGCCQNLTQSRQPAMVGGSVHDADLLVTDRSASPASEVQFMHGRPNPNTQNSPIGAASA